MSSRLHRLQAATLTLLVLVVFAASVFPLCAGDSCCARAKEPEVQAPMGCCGETSMAPSDAVDSLPASSASSPKPAALAIATPAAAEVFPPRVHPAIALTPPRLHDPDPPLFLLNEQFLI